MNFFPFGIVENNGVEPLTSCVQGRRSSQLSYTPNRVSLLTFAIASVNDVVPSRFELLTPTLSV